LRYKSDVAKTDPWFERAAARDERDLPELFASLTKKNRPATEDRLAALTAWPKSAAVAKHASTLLRSFPFDVWALGGATRARGRAGVHGAPAAAFAHTELARFSADVERWRKPALEAARRFTARARLAKQVGEVVVSSESLPDKPKALHVAWMKLAASRAPGSLGQLLESLGRGAATDITVRAIELLSFERDARIADVVVELLEYPPVTVRESNPLFVALGLTLVAHGDARHGPALEKFVQALPQLEWLGLLLDPRSTSASPLAVQVDAASKPRGPADERSFVAWIAEAPDDLARRSVFADWLSGRGDPRGELMALQLASAGGAPSPAVAKRVALLLKKHQKAWLRPIARNLLRHLYDRHRNEPVFEDGLLSAIQLDLSKSAPKPDEPLLVGLRRLVVLGGDSGQATKLMASPLLSGLRELESSIPLAAALHPAAKARLQTLNVRISARSELATLSAIELPALRSFGYFDGYGLDLQPEEVFALPLTRRLEKLCVNPSNDPGAWLASARAAGLRSLELRAHLGARFHFTLEPEPRLLIVLEQELDDFTGHRWFVEALATVPPDVRTRSLLELRRPALLTPEAARAIEALGVATKVVRG
jgi:uncharacterized protein (TIGR02996 family)